MTDEDARLLRRMIARYGLEHVARELYRAMMPYKTISVYAPVLHALKSLIYRAAVVTGRAPAPPYLA